MPGRTTEQYTYQIGNIDFIVSPVYPENPSGETVSDILLKRMRVEAEGITTASASLLSRIAARYPRWMSC